MNDFNFIEESERLRDQVYLGQPFYEFYSALSRFLLEATKSYQKFSPSVTITEDYVKLEHKIIVIIQRLRKFHEVHCQLNLKDSLDKTGLYSTVEDNVLEFSSITGPESPINRRTIYKLALECRSLLNYFTLSTVLKEEILVLISYCNRFREYIPNMDLYAITLDTKVTLSNLSFDAKAKYGIVKKNVEYLLTFKDDFNDRDRKDISDLHVHYNALTKKLNNLSINLKQKYIDKLMIIFDHILIKYTYLPCVPKEKLVLKYRLYNNHTSIKGLLGDKNVFLNAFTKSDFNDLDPLERADFLYVLKTLSQANSKNTHILKLMGIIDVNNQYYLIFEDFELTLFDVIKNKVDRNVGNINTFVINIVSAMKYFYYSNIQHGSVIFHNIFIKDNTYYLGYVDVFKNYLSIMNRKNVSYPEKNWKNIIYTPPELFKSKNPVYDPLLISSFAVDIYSFGIVLYTMLTPLFSKDWTNRKERQKVLKKYKYPYSHAMHIASIEFEREKNLAYVDLHENARKRFDKRLTKRLISLIVDNQYKPMLPSSLEDYNKYTQNIIFLLNLCWSYNYYERPNAFMIEHSMINLINNIESMDLPDDSDFELYLIQDSSACYEQISINGLEVDELVNILNDYYSRVKPELCKRVKSIAFNCAIDMNLEQLSKELQATYGVGLDLKGIKLKYRKANNIVKNEKPQLPTRPINKSTKSDNEISRKDNEMLVSSFESLDMLEPTRTNYKQSVSIEEPGRGSFSAFLLEHPSTINTAELEDVI